MQGSSLLFSVKIVCIFTKKKSFRLVYRTWCRLDVLFFSLCSGERLLIIVGYTLTGISMDVFFTDKIIRSSKIFASVFFSIFVSFHSSLKFLLIRWYKCMYLFFVALNFSVFLQTGRRDTVLTPEMISSTFSNFSFQAVNMFAQFCSHCFFPAIFPRMFKPLG